VEHGFRLPSALDNRPLRFEEFDQITGQIIFITATPGPFEREHSPAMVPQLIRPTGIVDPPVEVRPLKGQIEDLMEEIRVRAERKERVLVSTLTKRTAEDLTEYLHSLGIRVQYLHSDIDALQRVELLRGLRNHDFDCLVGINLLREGLDLPEVSLVAILDADKEGFLRSETSLTQTSGRAARHLDGKVLLYADHVTNSMKAFLDKTDQRRYAQLAYNTKHQITPRAINKKVMESLLTKSYAAEAKESVIKESGEDLDVVQVIADMEKEMLEAAEKLQFERAAVLRDQINELRAVYGGGPIAAAAPMGPARYRTRKRASHAKRGKT
jgi:excinuclease ABC subunit B